MFYYAGEHGELQGKDTIEPHTTLLYYFIVLLCCTALQYFSGGEKASKLCSPTGFSSTCPK